MSTRKAEMLAALGCALALAAPGSAAALTLSGAAPDHAHVTWRDLTGIQSGPTEEVGMLRTSDGVLRVAWPHGGSLLQALIAPDGAVVAAPPIVTGWQALTSPALVETGAGFGAFFGGIRSPAASDPNRNLNVATSADHGTTWSVAQGSVASGGLAYTSPITAVIAAGRPIEAWASGAGLLVHAGLDPSTPSVEYQHQVGGPGALWPRLVVTPGGSVALAWYSGARGAQGVYVQGVNPTTGAPLGTPLAFPGLAVSGNVDVQLGRTPLVIRPVLGGLFSSYRGAWPGADSVRVWGIGQPRSSLFHAHRNGAPKSVTTVAADAEGRLWAVYVVQEGRQLTVTTQRFDARQGTALFGSPVLFALPPGAVGPVDVQASAQPDRLDVLFTASTPGGVQTWSTQVQPGLTLNADVSAPPAGRRRTVSFETLDAGQPAPHARIAFLGHHLVTDGKGRASIVVSATRPATATARKQGYVDATARVEL